MLPDPIQREVLTSHPPLTNEAGEDELGEDANKVTPRKEWVVKVYMVRQDLGTLGRRINVDDRKFKTLMDNNLEVTEKIHKEFEGRQRDEF